MGTDGEAEGRCVCCGLSARPKDDGAIHHGQRWCSICIGRGHHEDGPMVPDADADADADDVELRRTPCRAGADQSSDPSDLSKSVCYCGHPRYYDYKNIDGNCPCLA